MNTLRFHFTLLVISLFSIFNAPALKAQSALDGFESKTNGPIYAVVVQPDGKTIIGGEFTTVTLNGGAVVGRNCIARFNSDGTLDMAFNPSADQMVLTLAVQPDGKVLAGGKFLRIGGQTRNYVARLDAVTGMPDSFNPNPWNPDPYFGHVQAIVVQADGKILIGGDFHKVGGSAGVVRISLVRVDKNTGMPDSFNPSVAYNRVIWSIAVQADGKILAGGTIGLARFNKDTGQHDSSFNPQADDYVNSIVVQPDSKILVGGMFTSIGGQPRNRFARLDKDTGMADSFNPNMGGLAFFAAVTSIVIQSDGKILAGGRFNSVGGQPRNNIARVDAITGLADSFTPNPNGYVNEIGVQQDGKIVVGSGANFGNNGIARFERDGLLDRTLNNLNLGGDYYVSASAVQADGKIIIVGYFTHVLGVPRNHIARLNTDGTVDTGFNPNADFVVHKIAIQPDGKIVVLGSFNNIGGQARRGIARLDKDTGLADSFNPYSNDWVWALAIQSDGKILVGGFFTYIVGQSRYHIARLDPTTGAPDSFDPNANHWGIRAIAIQPDGKILVGGNFTHIGGQPRNRLARLDATTGLADSFDPNVNDWVHSIAVQSDGKILVGGNFTSVGGQPRNRLARLEAVTGAPDSFDPNANGYVHSIAIQSDGKILAGGEFTSIGGQSRTGIVRLDATTGAADSFNPNANGSVSSIVIQRDGKILLSGNFTGIGGQPRHRFARLTNDTAALSTLSVSRTTVTLTRNGSAALLNRVLFEVSTDNGANWTALGTATNSFAPSSPPTRTNENGENQFAPLAPEAAGYTLTGLNLPTGQNILVRAKGILGSGYQNGLETNEDRVQIAFLPVPTAAQVSVSGRVLNADGSGLRNASVMLTDANGNTRSAVSGSFGYFRFDAVQAGETYVVSVVAKGHQFTPQAVTVNEELSELSFTALE